MTKDEAISRIKTLSHFTADDIIGLEDCTEPQLELILRTYRDTKKAADRDTFKRIGEILQQVPDWAPIGLAIIKLLEKIF